jgi:hypothetical protein
MNSGKSLLAEYDAKHDTSALQEAVECFRTAAMLEIHESTDFVISELASIFLKQFEQGGSSPDKRLIHFQTLDTAPHRMDAQVEADVVRFKAIFDLSESRAHQSFP